MLILIKCISFKIHILIQPISLSQIGVICKPKITLAESGNKVWQLTKSNKRGITLEKYKCIIHVA